MKDDTGFNANDEFRILGNIIIRRDDCSVYGCYKDGKQILAKDMSREELLRAHDIVRKHTFDIVGEENKGG